MGRVMSLVRGKIEGKIVNEEVKKALENINKA
jgi:GatB domain.